MITTPPAVFTLIDKVRPLQTVYAKNGMQIRLVGGCVRDAFLGKIAQDIDLATPLPPDRGMALLRQEGFTCIPTGIQHGTFTVLLNNEAYEITTLRQDLITDGRRAMIVFSNDWEIDAARRDLTINALYADFDGTIYDYFEGIKDLYNGTIRFIGDAESRIKEDYLRLLRLFRFHAWYGKHPLDVTTLKVCQRLANKLSTLSKERITKEMLRLLEAKNPLKSLTQMAIHQVLPSLFQNNALRHLAILIKQEEHFQFLPNPLRRLLILTNDYSLFCLSNVQKTYLKKRAELADMDLFHPIQRRYFLSIHSKEVIRDAVLVKHIQECQGNEGYLQQIVAEINNTQVPPFPINGTDLVKMNLAGSKIGTMLQQCRWWWAKNDYHPSKEKCIEWIKQQLNKDFP